jgi:spore coat protein A
MVSRRKFLKSSAALSALASLPLSVRWHVAQAATAAVGLSDPALQPKFVNLVPDAMAPGFIYQPDKKTGEYTVRIQKAKQATGLIDPATGKALKTDVWGYGDPNDGLFTWPGRTFEVRSVSAGGPDETVVNWQNGLRPVDGHLLPVDTNLHWCYSLHGASSANGVDYTQYSIAEHGVPIITHLHGGHSDFQYDGNPEFFYGPEGMNRVIGPQWDAVSGGFTEKFRYDNNVDAGNLWYHDHALGITRLNVYAGLAGYYFVRDLFDTGISANTKKGGNPLGLPAWPYEKAYAIQDRMFRDTGELFYPAFPDEPFYNDFIIGEDAELPPDLFPDGGPSALAEFFGDHMVVNGVIWPKENVEPRNYRMHLLNGTDSRFMAIRFRVAAGPAATDLVGAGEPLTFHVIGSDQGLAPAAIETERLVFEPGSRYDIVVDFSQVPFGSRVIMENIGGDAPFGGDFGCGDGDEDDCFVNRCTDRVMAFDVVLPLDNKDADAWSVAGFEDSTRNESRTREPTNVRKVALFEGVDEFGRLQPLLGTVDGESGDGFSDAYTWFQATTEAPMLGAEEDWEIYNFTGDAHPIHLHLVNFETIGRNELVATEGAMVPTTQHNGTSGMVASFSNVAKGADISASIGPAQGYVETTRKDMVTALPEQVTTIRVSPFDKTGRYVWHCHILSHEDHEMMRVLEVV